MYQEKEIASADDCDTKVTNFSEHYNCTSLNLIFIGSKRKCWQKFIVHSQDAQKKNEKHRQHGNYELRHSRTVMWWALFLCLHWWSADSFNLKIEYSWSTTIVLRMYSIHAKAAVKTMLTTPLLCAGVHSLCEFHTVNRIRD